MSEDMVIRCCAPTLAGMKTGNLFSCPYTSKEDFLHEVRHFNCILVPKGLCMLPLQYMKNRVLVYLFRPSELKRDLENTSAVELLKNVGYQGNQWHQYLFKLIQRLHSQKGFPHEIGLFLSYPPEDVLGFIENKARNFKCVGCWKVYGDEQEAKKRFAQYKKCTSIYCKSHKQGKSIEQLVVAS